MEILIGFLIVLMVVTLAQVLSVKRTFQGLQSDIVALPGRLRALKEELERLIREMRDLRPGPGVARPPEESATQRAAAPPPKPAAFSAPPMPPPPPVPPPPEIPPAIRAAAPSVPPPTAPPTAIPVPPKEPSQVLLSAQEILRRIWQWILVGEEYRPAGVTMEYAVATTWLMRAGIVIVVLGIAYFLIWSIDRGLITREWRVGLSILAGIAMLLGGIRLQSRRWSVLGQGFLGGGLATLYFSMFAAGPLYGLLPTAAVFTLMILVTLTAGVLALRTSSMLVAIFGIIGGFCTPILLRTHEPNLPVLYSYLLLLGVGVLGIAHFKQWRLLNYLAFIFTYVLFFGSLAQYQRRDFPLAITFLSLFFVVQSLIVYLYHISRGARTTILEIIHLILNAGVFSLTGYHLIRDAVGRPYPALLTLALAVFYILHVGLFLRRQRADRPLLVSLLALAGFYTALTMPLVMEKESLTICWAALAFMFVWLGGRLESHFLRQMGYVLYAVVFGRLLALDIPRNFDLGEAHAPIARYWREMAQRLWTFGLAIASLFGAFSIERARAARRRPEVSGRTNDTPDIVPSGVASQALFVGAILFLFLFLQLEFYTMLGYFTPLRPAVSTLLWLLMAAFFLLRYRVRPAAMSWLVAALVFIGAAAVKTMVLDMPSWRLGPDGWFGIEYTALYVLMRWLDFAPVLGLIMAGWLVLRHDKGQRPLAHLFGSAGLALLFLYLTLEVNSLLHWKLPPFQAGGISILWTLFAAGLVGGGIWKNARAVRFVGLTLFAVVVAKVFAVDLQRLEVVYRFIAFIVVGVILLLGATAYLHANRQFRKER